MRFAFIFAALVTLTAAPALAADAELCRAVDRIVAAARETPPFESVRHLPGDAQVIAGFRARDCRVTPERSIECSVIASTRSGAWPSLVDCPGVVEVPVTPSPMRLPVSPVRYRRGGVDFGFALGCQRCAGPAFSQFWAEVTGIAPD